MRWEPPPEDEQNGIITGYKLRYKVVGGRGDTVTTDSNRRAYALSDLERGKSYQIRVQALTVNGSGPATRWLQSETYVHDLDGEYSEPPLFPEKTHKLNVCFDKHRLQSVDPGHITHVTLVVHLCMNRVVSSRRVGGAWEPDVASRAPVPVVDRGELDAARGAGHHGARIHPRVWQGHRGRLQTGAGCQAALPHHQGIG